MVANSGLTGVCCPTDGDDGKGMTLPGIVSKLAKDKKGGLSYYDNNMDGWRGRKIKVT